MNSSFSLGKQGNFSAFTKIREKKHKRIVAAISEYPGAGGMRSKNEWNFHSQSREQVSCNRGTRIEVGKLGGHKTGITLHLG